MILLWIFLAICGFFMFIGFLKEEKDARKLKILQTYINILEYKEKYPNPEDMPDGAEEFLNEHREMVEKIVSKK